MHEIGTELTDNELQAVCGREHGMHQSFVGVLLKNLFGSDEALHNLCTTNGRNAVRVKESGEWCIWFWQGDRKSWYVQLTSGIGPWMPGDRIFTQIPLPAQQAA
jgi:hypothetical protein